MNKVPFGRATLGMNIVYITNQFVTSKNELSSSPIHGFKALHINQRAF